MATTQIGGRALHAFKIILLKMALPLCKRLLVLRLISCILTGLQGAIVLAGALQLFCVNAFVRFSTMLMLMRVKRMLCFHSTAILRALQLTRIPRL
mmetsp:Transcript_32295/g.80440  ORF Transcript_32295/g.80440 Transcript_32295/m.80440 type:complete len:96 (-) Transcript_32295:347-634(-)